MPIYEEEGRVTRDDLLALCKTNRCKECGGGLDVLWDMNEHKAYLVCHLDQTHEGIEREASRYQKEGLASLNIPTRRTMMTQDYGKATTTALDKYMGVVSLTKPQAKEILQAVYPEAPGDEIARAVMLCASYGLNPLMKHIFLIKFNRWNKGHTQIIGEDWVTVMGIKAKRLLSSRRGSYSYVDNTPRIMTEAEQRATFGETDSSKLWVMTKVKDPQTSAEAVGYGFWPRDSEPHGTEKGNTKFNMAAIRSESQALDRLRPGEMPEGIEVVPEEVAEGAIEGEYTEVGEQKVNTQTGEILPPAPEPAEGAPPLQKEHWCQEHNCKFEKKTRGSSTWYAHKLPDGSWCNEAKQKEKQGVSRATADEPEPEVKPKKSERDPDTIKTLNDLYKACNEDFKDAEGKGMQPDQVIAELGVNSQTDISDTPTDCYRRIAAVR